MRTTWKCVYPTRTKTRILVVLMTNWNLERLPYETVVYSYFPSFFLLFYNWNTHEDDHKYLWTTSFWSLLVLWRPDFKVNLPSLSVIVTWLWLLVRCYTYWPRIVAIDTNISNHLSLYNWQRCYLDDPSLYLNPYTYITHRCALYTRTGHSYLQHFLPTSWGRFLCAVYPHANWSVG